MPNKEKLGIFKYWLPVLICAGMIFYVSSLPGTRIPDLFSFQDVGYHILIYLILGLLFSRALKNNFRNLSATKILIFTFIFTFFYGISDEFHQCFVPYRNLSSFDVSLNGLGGLFGGLLYRWRK